MYADLLKIPKYTNWSEGAIECFKRNCVCPGCETFNIIGRQCKMKYAVIQLIRYAGYPNGDKPGHGVSVLHKEQNKLITSPKTERKGKIEITKDVGRHCHADTSKEREVTMHDNDLNLDYPNYCAKLIDAVKKGYENYDDLEKASGQNRKLLSVYFDGFHKFLLTNKLIQTSDKSKRQAVIDFIQSRLCDTGYKQNEQPAQIHEQNTAIDEQNTAIDEQNIPLDEQPSVSVTKSAMISRIADLSEQCTALMSENKELRERIKELENQPKSAVDFSEAKQKLHTQIEQLQTQLEAIRIAERMMNKSEV